MTAPGGAWWLDDAEQRAAAAPDSFFIPPASKRAALRVGDLVKLLFRSEPAADGFHTERMWVEVTAIDRGSYTGRLRNEPQSIPSLKPGDHVAFGPEHVAAYAWTAEELGYDPNALAWTRQESSVPPGATTQKREDPTRRTASRPRQRPDAGSRTTRRATS